VTARAAALAAGVAFAGVAAHAQTAEAPASFAELAGAAAARAPADLPRRVVRDAFVSGRTGEATALLAAFVAEAFRRPGGVSDPALIERLARAADGALLLTLGDSRPVRGEGGAAFVQPLRVRMREDVATWLFGSDERFALLADTLSPRDNAPAVWWNLAQLHDHDPAGRTEYFELMLALAVVWDQPRRPLHGQMGGSPLPFEPALTARYDYFKQLYASREARIPYARLNVDSLIFVVDTPVPLSELEWARKNVRGAAASWGQKFHAIKYNQLRVDQSVFDWPHGQYTLANIEARGGICVDQAYYAVLTARAWGIPAIFFAGPGRRGGHAWFAFLKGEDRWEMDVGRFEEDQYQTGFTVNPQTNERMTDHEIAYQCERALRRKSFERAQQLTRIAQILLAAGDAPNAIACARQARGAVPITSGPGTSRPRPCCARATRLAAWPSGTGRPRRFPGFRMSRPRCASGRPRCCGNWAGETRPRNCWPTRPAAWERAARISPAASSAGKRNAPPPAATRPPRGRNWRNCCAASAGRAQKYFRCCGSISRRRDRAARRRRPPASSRAISPGCAATWGKVR